MDLHRLTHASCFYTKLYDIDIWLECDADSWNRSSWRTVLHLLSISIPWLLLTHPHKEQKQPCLVLTPEYSWHICAATWIFMTHLSNSHNGYAKKKTWKMNYSTCGRLFIHCDVTIANTKSAVFFTMIEPCLPQNISITFQQGLSPMSSLEMLACEC